MPIGLNYLGPEIFALWATILHLITFLGLGDLGLGIVLQNSIATAKATEDTRAMQRVYKGVLTLLLLIAAITIVISGLVIEFTKVLSWSSVISNSNEADIKILSFTLSVLFCINLPLALIQRVALGLHLGASASIAMAAANVASLAISAIIASVGLSRLLFCSVPFVAQIAANIGLAFYLMGKSQWLKTSPFGTEFTQLVPLLKKAVLYLVPQLAAVLLSVLAPLAVIKTSGAEAAVAFNIMNRLVGIPGQVLSMLTIPLWSVFTTARAAGERIWIKKSFISVLKFSSLFGMIFAVVYATCGPKIVRIWVGDDQFAMLNIENIDYALFAVLGACTCVTPVTSSLINGAGRPFLQAVLGFLNAASVIILLSYLPPKFGLTGVVASQVIVYLCIDIPLSLLICTSIINQKSNYDSPAVPVKI